MLCLLVVLKKRFVALDLEIAVSLHLQHRETMLTVYRLSVTYRLATVGRQVEAKGGVGSGGKSTGADNHSDVAARLGSCP